MRTPNANITGVYTTLQDMIYNSYKFLQKIAPGARTTSGLPG